MVKAIWPMQTHTHTHTHTQHLNELKTKKMEIVEEKKKDCNKQLKKSVVGKSKKKKYALKFH